MEFTVTYINSSGEKISENIIDDNIENILMQYKSKDCRILKITEINNKNKILLRNKIKQHSLNNFLRQFSILLKSGLDVKFAVKTLQEQESNDILKNALKDIETYLNSGFTLSESFNRTHKFPELFIGIISAGEYSSTLPQSLEILSDYYESEKKVKENLKNALYYPIILLAVTFIVVSLIISFVLPKYIELFNSYENLELPLMTQILIFIGDFLNIYGVLVLVLFILIILILYKLVTKDMLLYISKKILSLPFIGKYIVNYETQRFSGILSLLLSSGIETIESINIASNSVNNIYFKEKITSSTEYILKGNTMYEAFERTSVFPNMFLNLINIGERSSNMIETMNISFNYYKDLVNQQSKKLTSIFEPLIIIVVSIIVGSIVIAIALPTFSLVNIL